MGLKPLSKPRNALVIQHMDFARAIALAVKRRLPPFILLEDLQSEAYVGLVKAARKFNFESKTPFKAYAYQRVRGAVFDSIRRRNFKHTATFQLTDFPDLLECCQDTPMARVEARIDAATVVKRVRQAVATLPEMDRAVVDLRYRKGLNGKQTGKQIGVGESRSSQLNQEMLGRLRNRVKGSPHYHELRRAA